MSLAARLCDVGAWLMMLGAAAFLGVLLDRVAYELAPWLTGSMTGAGSFVMLLRWSFSRRM